MARSGMEEFLGTVHAQMRRVTLFHIAVYINNCAGSAKLDSLPSSSTEPASARSMPLTTSAA